MSNKNLSTLSLEIHDHIAHLRFTRPALLNRFDELAHLEFADVLDDIGRDPAVRALVISADGKVFSAGGDFEEIIQARDSVQARERIMRDARRVFRSLVTLPVPVIAAVQGASVGMGATVMTLCDIVVAYENAKVSDPHVSIGLVAGDGGIIGWSQAAGLMRAKRFLLTGDAMSARDAYEMGLVTDLVEAPEEALERALQIARRIADLPRAGVEGTKRAFMRLTEQTAHTVFEAGLAYEMESMTRPEVAEMIANLKKK
ncbi:enoyl-CoA hydratase/isomerase family protein [Cupriavidus necator]|uniref:enoyl-CoA hydratase/isomerase family protein n=1 Tax=Cupriavidus necator TaxID=106590 RepID=UPI003ECE0EDC